MAGALVLRNLQCVGGFPGIADLRRNLLQPGQLDLLDHRKEPAQLLRTIRHGRSPLRPARLRIASANRIAAATAR